MLLFFRMLILPGPWSRFTGRRERSGTPREAVVQEVSVVPHLEAREITVEAVLSSLLSQLSRFIVVLQPSTVHTTLDQFSYHSMLYQHRVPTCGYLSSHG